VGFDDPLADSQPDACAGIFLSGVQPAKGRKDVFPVFFVDPDAVVRHAEMVAPVLSGHGDMDARRLCAAKFEGIAQQILQ